MYFQDLLELETRDMVAQCHLDVHFTLGPGHELGGGAEESELFSLHCACFRITTGPGQITWD